MNTRDSVYIKLFISRLNLQFGRERAEIKKYSDRLLAGWRCTRPALLPRCSVIFARGRSLGSVKGHYYLHQCTVSSGARVIRSERAKTNNSCNSSIDQPACIRADAAYETVRLSDRPNYVLCFCNQRFEPLLPVFRLQASPARIF